MRLVPVLGIVKKIELTLPSNSQGDSMHKRLFVVVAIAVSSIVSTQALDIQPVKLGSPRSHSVRTRSMKKTQRKATRKASRVHSGRTAPAKSGILQH